MCEKIKKQLCMPSVFYPTYRAHNVRLDRMYIYYLQIASFIIGGDQSEQKE